MEKHEKINIFTLVYKTIYDFNVFKYIKERPMSYAFLYMLVLTLIFGSFQSIGIIRSMNDAFAEMKIYFDKDFPEFTITEKGLDVKAKMPIISEEKEFFYAVDTTGKIDRKILDKHPKGVFIDRHRIYYKKSIFETREYDLSPLYRFAPITKDSVKKLFSYYWVIVLFIIPFYFIYFFSGKAFSSLVVAIFGLILQGLVKSGEGFKVIFKLSAFSLTLPVLIKAVISFFGIEIPLFFLMYYGAGIFYLLMALKTLRTE